MILRHTQITTHEDGSEFSAFQEPNAMPPHVLFIPKDRWIGIGSPPALAVSYVGDVPAPEPDQPSAQ